MDNITMVPKVTRGLVARGYSDEDIEKILGKNNLRVFKEVLK
jgi:membrane dipeptidase